MNELVYIEKHDTGVAEIVLNNPARKNAMGAPMMRELCAAVLEVQDDDEVRAIVLRGEGFSLALACDMVYAADEAIFSSNFLHVALAPEMGAMVFLSQACGVYKAKELWYSGRRVTGLEGFDLGFVSVHAPAAELMEKAMESAEKIATLPRTPLRIMKRIVNTHVLSEVPAVLAADAQDSPLCFLSEEGLAYLAENFMKKK